MLHLRVPILIVSIGLNVRCHALDKAKQHYEAELNDISTKYNSTMYNVPTEKDFSAFVKTYGKTYNHRSSAWQEKFAIFKENAVLAQSIQANEKGTARYGVTKFSDMSVDDFRKYYRNLDYTRTEFPKEKAEIPTDFEFPSEIDWRQKKAVTPVKNQRNCGSCWSFSTTGNIEGQNAVQNGELQSLSEQQLLDCDEIDAGCNGGLPTNAMRYIQNTGGIEPESVYPYISYQRSQCRFNKSAVAVLISGFVSISNNEADMAKWCAKNGPISIGINAEAMQFYQGGVSFPSNCSPAGLDHAVLIVGYGIDESVKMPFWIIKNSWGADWGEQGYYRVYRGAGICGLNRMPISAVVQ